MHQILKDVIHLFIHKQDEHILYRTTIPLAQQFLQRKNLIPISWNVRSMQLKYM